MEWVFVKVVSVFDEDVGVWIVVSILVGFVICNVLGLCVGVLLNSGFELLVLCFDDY